MHVNAPWWRSAVIYQIYIRSFADANGDGIGDIAGIRSRLPYLRDLGVDAVWITPWYPSPMADGGYDVADYTDIDPMFGTLADADALIRDAHDHGIRVIIDIVPNHTSDRHKWFQAALAAGPGSPERDRYVFRTGRGADGELPPNDWRSTFGGSAWTRLPDGEWYLHLFAPEQPDLNWENPEVRAEFERVLAFWFDRGVDGFRIDVAHGLIKQDGLPDLGGEAEDVLEPSMRLDHPHWDRDGVHEIYRGWRRVADRYDGDRTFVAEAWVATPERLARYLRSDELHTAFNFDYLRASWDAPSLREVIDASLGAFALEHAPATWVLSNHDVVRHVTRYGRTHTGGRGPQSDVEEPVDLELGTRRARAAALLMLALPGGAYVYQGEELGLPEVEDLPESALQDPVWERSGHTSRGRDGCRVPIPWSGDTEPYGFGPDGSTPWLPQPESWKGCTAEAEAADPASTLELYRAALRLRREHAALGDGDLTWDDGAPDGVLRFTRTPGFACVVNLSGTPQELPADAEVLLASGPLDGGLLPTDTAAWLAVSD
ncbi:glycoside hydrolase family 13 protein [Actinoallomurus rhizosphaericola]|uniref:glycoside hydrolase family 13 protein n=1 Tax=Actinoallomurus rhizosphaericola TaxID=2952536 RepID=UPI00209357BF|nr:glycoside hydrolase family 13 protein [Actinoallomurus rhizosphaericola]MCO5998176.1 glycoside hydrolase family 13 protein [Actinoallomurus rhizosphaericola]